MQKETDGRQRSSSQVNVAMEFRTERATGDIANFFQVAGFAGNVAPRLPIWENTNTAMPVQPRK